MQDALLYQNVLLGMSGATHLEVCCRDCDIVRPHDPDHLGSASAVTSLNIPDMLANIKRNAISKCRPVRQVHPPMENICLVGQTSGRIKWIQPSGVPPPAVMHSPCTSHCMCSHFSLLDIVADMHGMHACRSQAAW